MRSDIAASGPIRKPLPAGTEIEFCEERAIVVDDPGGIDGRLMVNVGEFETPWYWKFEGVECRVVSQATPGSNP